MAVEVIVRNVPSGVHSWLKDQAHENRVSMNEVCLRILQKAQQENGTLSLFDNPGAMEVEPQGLPFSFADLFAGIGGLRIGLEAWGGHCVFSSEWDIHSQRTYKAWYGETPAGDITKIKPADIPDHDLLAAGFPCQPFSIAGVSKKKSLGRAHGFKDKTQGTLFFHLATIIEIKRPPILLLENVKNLQSHDGGRTWKVIKSTLEDLRYHVFSRVVDAAGWVPQHRERIFIVGFDQRVFRERPAFEFPGQPMGRPQPFRSILEENPDTKYTLSDHLWRYLRNYAEKHQAKGNGFGYGLVDLDGISRTLSARYYKDGSEILIPQGRGKNPRRLTPRECARLMGFDDRYPIVVSDTQAYRQFGNAVAPPVVRAVAGGIMKTLAAHLRAKGNGCLIKAATPQHARQLPDMQDAVAPL